MSVQWDMSETGKCESLKLVLIVGQYICLFEYFWFPWLIATLKSTELVDMLARKSITWRHVFGNLFMFIFQKKTKKKTYGSYNKQQQKQVKPKREIITNPALEKTVKQLLGELYGDKIYLEKLLKEIGVYFHLELSLSTSSEDIKIAY